MYTALEEVAHMSTPSGGWVKDPLSTLDWTWDWSQWLLSGESLLTSTFTATPGITVQSSSFTITSATVWLAGGTSGTPYQVSNLVTTTMGRTDERSITIRVQQR